MERDLHGDISRGVHAERELGETNAAFDAVKAAIVKEMLQTSPMQGDKILQLHRAAQIVDAVREALKKTVAAGEHAAATIAAQEALAESGLTRP